MGDIGNKNLSLAKQQDVKKIGSVLPVLNKAGISQQAKLPKMEIMETEESVNGMDDTVEMEPESVFPDGVLDIDEQDRENPQLCAEYAPAMYAYLRTVEEGLVIKRDFLKGYGYYIVFRY